jgi:hypothetical protein
MERYFSTKLMDLLLTRQLSQSPAIKQTSDGNAVVICAVDPGRAKSQLGRNLPEERQREMAKIPSLTAEEGAKNFVWVCLEDDVPAGSYVGECAVAK